MSRPSRRVRVSAAPSCARPASIPPREEIERVHQPIDKYLARKVKCPELHHIAGTDRKRSQGAEVCERSDPRHSPDTKALAKSQLRLGPSPLDRKSTRLNSSHLGISYAVF